MFSTSGAGPSSHQPQLQEKPDSGRAAVSFQRPTSRSGKLSIDDITKFFSLPIAEAASILGVSDGILKRICRENGIIRWPYRKFLAGKTAEAINKDGIREKTKEVNELSSCSHIDTRAAAGAHMSGQVFQMQGSKLVQYGWSGIPQPLQPKNISTYMDEFEFGFPSNGLSSVSVKWWVDGGGGGGGGGGEDSRMLPMDDEPDKQETCVPTANETNSGCMMDEESDSNIEDRAILSEPSASLCFLRKRSAEYGQESLEDRVSKGCDSSRLTKRQRSLLSQVFNASFPS